MNKIAYTHSQTIPQKKGPVALRQAVNPLRAWRLPTSQKTYAHDENCGTACVCVCLYMSLYAHVYVLVCGGLCAYIHFCASVCA